MKENLISRNYVGVGGWLAILCLGLIVLNPLLAILKIWFGLRVMDAVYMESKTVLTHWILLITAAAIYGLMAGMRLWRIKPGAPGTAKRFLLLSISLSILAIFQVMVMELPASFEHKAVMAILNGALLQVLLLFVCYCYLNLSKRVRSTYPDHRERATAEEACSYGT